MNCNNCGFNNPEGSNFCSSCGKPLNNNQTGNVVNDSGNALWGIFAFFFPLIGIILYFVWRKEKPVTSKGILILSIISIIIYIIVNYFFFFAIVDGISSMG